MGVSTSVLHPDRYADQLCHRTLERSDKAVIPPSSLRSDARHATTDRFAPLRATERFVAAACVEGASPSRGARLTPCKPVVGHAVPRRMNDCLTTPFNGTTTQWVRVPIGSTNRGRHSYGRATQKDSMRFPPNTACPIAAFFGHFLCSSKESDCRPAQGRS